MNPGDIAAPGPLARNDGGAVFEEPWQAQVLGLAFHLVERGDLDAARWSRTLGAELERAAAAGKPDDAQTYYAAVLAALEALLAADGRIGSGEMGERTEAWRNAYLRTPHGQSVILDNARDGA